MNTILIWVLALIVLGLFIYFVPYRNIKISPKEARYNNRNVK